MIYYIKITLFNFFKLDTVLSRWNEIREIAARVNDRVEHIQWLDVRTIILILWLFPRSIYVITQ